MVVGTILGLPGKIGGIIFNSILQTVHKTAWATYQRDLRISLMRARYDFENGRLSGQELSEIESRIFSEMRTARRIVNKQSK